MRAYYADLHVHIGRSTNGAPVKIAASPKLTLEGIIDECIERKGIHLVGIVDAVCTPVFGDVEEACADGKLSPHPDGGLVTPDGRLVILPAAELEVMTLGRAAHYLAYFPTLDALRQFRAAASQHITNLSLSSQQIRVSPGELVRMVKAVDGLFMLAHAFTPHKGYFGNCAARLTEAFSAEERRCIDGIELGLSSESAMADRLSELHPYPYVSNSDAHSLDNIAREYNALHLVEPSFGELKKALAGVGGRKIAANYGLDPRLGKYFRTFCPTCRRQVPLRPERRCEECGTIVVTGVYDRLLEIADTLDRPSQRPPYIHQVPLRFIPGVGPKKVRLLLERFGSHMNILHDARYDELASVVGDRLADSIVKARQGELRVRHGAGGHYGKIEG